MNKFGLSILMTTLFISTCLFAGPVYKVKKQTDKNGYEYETVEGDPLETRIYRLENGLKIYLRVNKDAPRIQTLIAVKAGSTYDPPETTGLAHYLEHMMFKGTDEIGTLNWEKEKVLLREISDLYEKHRATDDTLQKKLIYAKIDSVSAEAAKYAVPNEYDKMVSSLGAKGTNAYTSHERTVYMNDIPVNEFEKWLKMENERFSKLVLRLFHTELETVYEEFNMSQDDDSQRAYYAMLGGLFPNHPYGTQTTLGKAEHLKNPSMVNIHKYWNTYYVPNNMAMCLSGDINPEKTVQMIDSYFGTYKPGELPELNLSEGKPIDDPVVKEVYGPNYERVSLAYRFDGVNSRDQILVTLVDMILNNAAAGLIDLDLVQKQKVIKAGCSPTFMKDYGYHRFYGIPRQGQTLDDVRDLILEEIDKVKEGEFDDWLVQAVINDLKLSRIRSLESNYGAASAFVHSFTNDIDWIDYLQFHDRLEEITKEEIMEFAEKRYQDNYVIVYKKTGKDTSIVKVKKPEITPVPLNRESHSEYFKQFTDIPSGKIEPVFVNFKEDISNINFRDKVDFRYIKNPANGIFSLYYIIDLGKNHNIKLPLAVEYLKYIGTEKYSAEELQKELYKYGIDFNVFTGEKRSYVYITGLKKSFEKGVELLEHILSAAKPDQQAYDNMIAGILKKREDAKKDKNVIMWQAMLNYGKYGSHSPFTNILSEEKLTNTKPAELIDIINGLFSWQHKIFYYGQHSEKEVKEILHQKHQTPAELKEYPEPTIFNESENTENKVYVVDYDMVQAQILLVSKDEQLNPEIIPYARLYQEYFGAGLSSVFFQEIRESRALAYTAMSVFSIPREKKKPHFVYAYAATQADKMIEATDAMLELLNEMPKAEIQFNAAREAIRKKIETERIIKKGIYWTWLSNRDMGIDYDYREDIYQKVEKIDLNKMDTFFNKHIKGKKYNFLVLGNKKTLDMEGLTKLGEVKVLELEDIFSY